MKTPDSPTYVTIFEGVGKWFAAAMVWDNTQQEYKLTMPGVGRISKGMAEHDARILAARLQVEIR